MQKSKFGEDAQYLLAQNLVGAKNFNELEIAEQFGFTVRALQFEQGAYQVTSFSSKSLVALHLHLFQDIYNFAGEVRDV